MLVEAACLLLPLLTALIFGENLLPFVYTVALLVIIGFPLSRINTSQAHFFSRDGFVAVALAWIVMLIFGALPFYFCGHFATFADCLFESASGFSTTGATVLNDIEVLPRGILFWRSFTHFLGGMGVLVLATAISSDSDDRAQHLMRAEVPGPTSDKLVPRLAQSSKILYGIYIALTVLQTLCLLIAGLPFYDAVNVALSTAGTGGFSVLNASIAGYNNTAVELITSVFMLVFAVNFSVYFLIITGKVRQALKSEELRFFIVIVVIAVAIIMANIFPLCTNLFQCFNESLFTVAAIISTTGFGITNHGLWPEMAKTVIIFLTLVGACAGSTGGGIKVSRVLIVLKSIVREIKQIIHPRSVNIVRLDGKSVDDDTVTSVLRFFGAYFAIIAAVTLITSFENFDFTTRLTAVITCMSNVGPGLGLIDPSGNFSIFSGFSKIILSLTMIIGRLEIFPILILFSPSTWKHA